MFRFAGRSLLCVAAAASTPSPDVRHAARLAEHKLDDLSPRKIVDILDRYIIGQANGKKAVAVALRNRWRRRQITDAGMQKEVMPKNMLLIGPTGVGKTEISRRMARITDAPFVKVEATRYTEVGFKGKDVESIIEDLYANAKSKARKLLEAERHEEALAMAIDTVYSAWSTQRRVRSMFMDDFDDAAGKASKSTSSNNNNNNNKNNDNSIDNDTNDNSDNSNNNKNNNGNDEEDSVEDRAALALSGKAGKTKPGRASDSDANGGDNSPAKSSSRSQSAPDDDDSAPTSTPPPMSEMTLEYFRAHYTTLFKDDMVAIDIAAPVEPHKSHPHAHMSSNSSSSSHNAPPPGAAGMGIMIGMGGLLEARRSRIVVRKTVAEAVPLARQDALGKLIDDSQVNALARALAEEDGIVFIDEIDKVVVSKGVQSNDVSSTGVQQDLLPLIEGSNVTMKDGSILATDNMLFICSGAFHTSNVADMIAELQGRLPVRVELKPLTEEDFRRILTEPKFNLLRQHVEMMRTENVTVEFTDEAVRELARVTTQINTQGQNIGARRLYTVLECVMDKYSFECEDYEKKTVTIDLETVHEATRTLQKSVSIARFLL